MGIPFFFKFICQKYSECIIDYDTFSLENTIENLYFDLNGLIHPCCSLARKKTIFTEKLEETINIEIENKIQEIIRMVNPKVFTMLSVDGVAPFAKINQQRSRRYKSYLFNKKINQINNKYGVNDIEFDTNMISPGTPFMNNLMKYLENFIIQQNNNGCNILLSTSNEEGEGEHKIFGDIRKNKNNPVSVIYGLDADLIMLSILCKKKNIYLLRESKEYGENDDKFLVLNIDKLRDSIVKEIYDYSKDFIIKSWKDTNLLNDYIFLCFLLGNDFIPSLTMLTIDKSSMTNLLKIYVKKLKKYNKYIIENSKINYEIFIEILEELNLKESNCVKNLHNNYFKKRYFENDELSPYEKEIRKIEYEPLLTRDLRNNYLCYDKVGWEDRYYVHYLNTDFNIEIEKKKMCHNYLEALNWILSYYDGNCICWGWFYQYNTAPLVSDLVNYLKENISPKIFFNQYPVLTPNEQLISILPAFSLRKIRNTKDILKNYEYLFPETFCEDYSYKTFSHQSIALLPPINYNIIKSILNVN